MRLIVSGTGKLDDESMGELLACLDRHRDSTMAYRFPLSTIIIASTDIASAIPSAVHEWALQNNLVTLLATVYGDEARHAKWLLDMLTPNDRGVLGVSNDRLTAELLNQADSFDVSRLRILNALDIPLEVDINDRAEGREPNAPVRNRRRNEGITAVRTDDAGHRWYQENEGRWVREDHQDIPDRQDVGNAIPAGDGAVGEVPAPVGNRIPDPNVVIDEWQRGLNAGQTGAWRVQHAGG